VNLPNLDRHSVVPLYYQIQQGLLERIRSGKLKPGEPVPSEEDIARQLRVSRMTARQALKTLCSLGVVFSERGKGTFVSGLKLEKNIRQVLSFSQDMLARGARPRSVVIAFEKVRADSKVAEALQLGPKEQVILLRRVRMADSLPMGVETAYLPHRLFPDLLDKFDPQTSLYQALAQFYGVQIVIADEIVEASLAGTEEARLMRVAKGSPVFLFTRTSHLASGTPVEFVRSVYRGDRYELVNRLTRRVGGETQRLHR
jgi:GntR family transcriptional regulator, N-acetylglucosamine utilization regulator